VKREQVREHECHAFSAEASQLGWPPGEFPNLLETDLGNGRRMVLTSLTEQVATYHQQFGCITLSVWND
jgi:predicted metalloenzyme YecM